VSGPSLQQAVAAHGPLSPLTVFRLLADVAEGLAAVHTCGIIHGDLKPANVLLADDGPRVIDFGIAHAAEATSLTRTGLSIGTPAFMARIRPSCPS
jgi:eukaryotic-like serine/threonine-protein kinase